MIAAAWDRVKSAVRSDPIGQDVGLRRVGLRLAAQTVGLVLVMLVVLEVVVYIITQRAQLGSLETTLQQRSSPPASWVRDVLHLGGSSPGGTSFPNGGGQGYGGPRGPGGPPPGPNPDQTPSDASTVYVNAALHIQHHDGALGSAILDTQALTNSIKSGTAHCCDVRRYRNQDYLVYTAPLRAQGRVLGAAQSSISEKQYEDTMSTLRGALLIVALLGLLGSGGVSLALVQRALRPIRIAVQRQRDFVADAAHELRTPLAIQRTVGEVGLAGDSVESSEATVEQMLAENKHLTRLVDDLSLLARADSHAVSITPARMNLSSLVQDTASELEPLAEERGAHLTAEVGPEIWVAGDVTRLRQLLLVLLDNALRFTPPGGTVRVRLQDGGGRAQLQVADSGPGIDPVDLPRIFDRFYRADKARAGEGSGLGLSIAKWIVDAHGGHIQAANAAPHGAVFTAILPAARHVRTT